jgi:hypothetical protein
MSQLQNCQKRQKTGLSITILWALPSTLITFCSISTYYRSNLFLFQIRKLAYAIKNSTTIILPKWNEIILQSAVLEPSTKKKLTVRKMPRDVTIRWNSTYDMLKFAYTYRDVINKITDDHSMKLRDYELKDHEWEIVEELRDSLKVRIFISTSVFFIYVFCRYLRP